MESPDAEQWLRKPFEKEVVGYLAGVCLQITRRLFDDTVEVVGLNNTDDPSRYVPAVPTPDPPIGFFLRNRIR